jgi:YegS/Rv2252/BmrU family lipid kinase
LAELLESVCDLKRVAFIFNPVSGTQEKVARRKRLEELAQDAGLTCELGETDIELGARPLAEKALADGMERVLISGGDGSVAEAAGVLAGTDVAIGVIPGGTGNLLALNLGLPTDPAAAFRAATTGSMRAIDVGRANGHVFLIVAGMGADARMVRDADRSLKKRWGVLAYFIAAIKNLGRPLSRFRVTVDGVTVSRRAQTIMVGNLGKITAGLELIPGADPADGVLEVTVIRARAFQDIALVLFRTLLGQHQSDNLTEIRRGRHIVIEADQPQPIEVDGNHIGSTRRLEVTVEPGALKILTPEQAPSLLPDPAALIAEVSKPHWTPLFAGVGTAVVLTLRARSMQAQGERPDLVTRHPLLSGLAVATVVGAVVAGGYLAAGSKTVPGPSDANPTETDQSL